jgi:hypothetical protein
MTDLEKYICDLMTQTGMSLLENKLLLRTERGLR